LLHRHSQHNIQEKSIAELGGEGDNDRRDDQVDDSEVLVEDSAKVGVDVDVDVDAVLAANSDDRDDDEKITMQQQQQQQQQQQRLTADLIQQQEEQLGIKNSNSITSEMCTTTLPNNSQPAAPSLPLPPPPPPPLKQQQQQQQQQQQNCSHAPTRLPTFKDPRACMWTSSHAANAPSEDRSASLVNVLLQPLPHTNFDNETQINDNFNNGEYHSLIRLNLWSVIDGHGGGCVATYASEVLLPHIAASISRALGCAIVSRGVCLVNGQLRDANALDLDGLIKSTGSDRSQSNSNSIHYRSPYERANTSTTDDSDNDKVEEDDDDDDDDDHHRHHNKNDHHVSKVVEVKQKQPKQQKQQHEEIPSHNSAPSPALTSSQQQQQQQHQHQQQHHQHQHQHQQQQSDDATSVVVDTTPQSNLSSTPLAGTHSPEEITAITQAITQSFLSVDEGWINSIDPVATHQTSCQSNGRWNSGACALTVFTVQRLEWTKVSSSEQGNNDNNDDNDDNDDHDDHDDDGEHGRRGEGIDCDDDNGGHDTSQNKDAARRRMLDHNATRALKSASSLSTISSTSSLTTTDDLEITETEGEEDDSISFNGREGVDKTKRSRRSDDRNISTDIHINAPGGCSCHCYRAYDAMLYTAHVGDCRAVLLGSAPPTMIKVHGSSTTKSGGPGNQKTDDESSHHSSDETECLSSSDHDADSSDDEEIMIELDNHRQRRQHNNQNHHIDGATAVTNATTTGTSTAGNSYPFASYMRVGRPPRRQSSRRRRYDDLGMNQPFIALPPLEGFRSIEIEIDPDCNQRKHRHHRSHNSNSNSNNNNDENDNNNSCGTGGTGGGSGNNNEEQSVASSSSSSSPSSQDSREFPPAIILPPATRPIDLTTDHSAYNPAEVRAVLRRCNNAPRAISSGMGGGIKRVAGSLAVTRALGDAYLKTPRLSFFPYKTHTPYITARPEVNCRHIVKGGDKVVVLATDGVWERAGGEDILRWARTLVSGCNNNNNDNTNAPTTSNTTEDEDMVDCKHPPSQHDDVQPQISHIDGGDAAGTVINQKRDAPTPPGTSNTGKRRKLTRRATPFGSRRNSTVAEVIINRVLNKVRRARNIKSLHALMSLPPGKKKKRKTFLVCFLVLCAV
jgi:hypothetical protein